MEPEIPVGLSPDCACFHCGLPVLKPGEFRSFSEGQMREFCCAGCLAVTDVITAGGMERYYALREAPGNRLDPTDHEQFRVYDNPRLQQGWLTQADHDANGEFLIEGIACAACIWLIEQWIAQLPGVKSASLNFTTHRLDVHWDPAQARVSDLMWAVYQIGYQALPYTREADQSLQEQQRRELLKRLGVAAALGMQIMVISVALYAGNWFGMEPELREFLRRTNLLLVLPIMGYSAQPFFRGALRGIRNRAPGMDLPVSLGISLAFAGSLWAVVSGHGEVYYDSIAMFVFFLLGARYLEQSTRLQGAQAMDTLAAVVPGTARRWRDDDTLETVPTVELELGECMLVRSGEVIPTDGVIHEGHSQFDESLITGEDRPVMRGVGEPVMAGSVNLSQPVTIEITACAGTTTLDSILRLAAHSHADKPRISQLAERVARWFVVGVVLLAFLVAIAGLWLGTPTWLPTTIAVLVVTCPCALSLATPLAFHAASSSLLRRGVHVIRGHVLETLCRVDHVIFDKTGTLTSGEMKLDQVITPDDIDTETAVRIAAALEQGACHPLARPLLAAAGNAPLPKVSGFLTLPGQGVHGFVDGKYYRLGSVEFVSEIVGHLAEEETANQNSGISGSRVMLANESKLLATFQLHDHIRPGARDLVKSLQEEEIAVSLLSGDRSRTVHQLACELEIRDARGECLPEQKLVVLKAWIEEGRVVAMVGDGINDAPALSQAHVGIAIAHNVNLAAVNADLVITATDLKVLDDARHIAARTFRIIRQNIVWALTYNILAIPAALAGMVPPWLAGVGMSASSVVVVLNAARLSRM